AFPESSRSATSGAETSNASPRPSAKARLRSVSYTLRSASRTETRASFSASARPKSLPRSLPLGIRVPGRGGKVVAEVVRCPTRAVARRPGLDSPALLQRPGVDDVEPELVDQAADNSLRGLVIARDDESMAIRRACGLSVGRELRSREMVEGFHDS